MVHIGNDDTNDQSKGKYNRRNVDSPSRHTPTLFGGTVCKCHDHDEIPEKSLYEKNPALFLVQSCLLGISYSIIWPTLWKLVTIEFKDFHSAWLLFLYGSTFVAYPLASMLAVPLLKKKAMTNLSMMFLLLNVAQFVGNLLYAANFHPAYLFCGRFIAGIGDAFFVVIMADARISRDYKGGSVAAQCLTVFIVGLVLAQVLNIMCIYIPFKLGDWSLQVWNLPSVLVAILFCIVGITNLTLGIDDEDNLNQEDLSEPKESTSTDDGPGFSSVFVCFFSFVHTFVISMLEILIPMFIYQRLEEDVLICVLLYIFLITLYALILIFTMSIDSPLMLEFSLIISVVLKMVALLCVVLMTANELGELDAVVAVVGVMICVAFVWSSEDVMYTNLILTLVAYRHREETNKMRQTTSKLAFVLSAICAPFLFNHIGILHVCVTLIVVVGVLFGLFITLRMFGRALRKD